MGINMDLSKFKKKQAKKYPTKTTMNLAQNELTENSPSKLVLPAILVVLLVMCFAKFGVYDQFAAVNEAERAHKETQAQLDAMSTKLAAYNETEKQYKLYSYGYLTEEESALVNRTESLTMIEQRVMSIGSVYNIEISKNTLVVTFSGVTLDRVGLLTTELKALPSVERVSVSTAATEDADSELVSASMVITLQKIIEGEDAK